MSHKRQAVGHLRLTIRQLLNSLTINEIKAHEVTVSIFREVPPTKLFKQLKDMGYGIDNRYPRIYYINGLCVFPLQIIVGHELPKDGYIWFKHLRCDLDKEEAKKINEADNSIDVRGFDKEDIKTVLTFYMNANKDVIAEILKEGGEVMQTIEEILEESIEERIEERIKDRIDKVVAEKDRDIAERDRNLAEKDRLIEKLIAENRALKAAQ